VVQLRLELGEPFGGEVDRLVVHGHPLTKNAPGPAIRFREAFLKLAVGQVCLRPPWAGWAGVAGL
jgi:hypothetical protein